MSDVLLDVRGLTAGYGEMTVLREIAINIRPAEIVAMVGSNGAGKTTLLRCLMNEITADSGTVKWSENVNIGYFAQDHAADFEEDLNLLDWMTQWRQPKDDEQWVRGVLGQLLFSGDDIKKSVRKISGGEQGRMLFGKLMLSRPNVLLMDEPTNHLDMESIESLNTGLEKFAGTLIFISHDREFVSSLASRIIEIRLDGSITDYRGTYEEYLASQGVE